MPRKAIGAFFSLMILAGVVAVPAMAADNVATLRLTVDEIRAESPAAVQRLIGAYSQIPDFPAGGKSVKLSVFRGTDLVCIAPIKGLPKEKITCWHWNDTPEPLQKLVNEKDAEFSEK